MLYDLYRYDDFMDNKYTKWYYELILSARTSPRSGYTERHHIIPKCLEGTDKECNLVRLTAREHYVCHLLLTKMTSGTARTKMAYGLWSMLGRNNKRMQRSYSVNSKIYAATREEFCKNMSRPYAEKYSVEKIAEIKQKQSKNHRGKNSAATRARISSSILKNNQKWYNNGVECKLYTLGTQPDGWAPGRTLYLKHKWRWYNNGAEVKRMIEGSQPSGWILGRPFALRVGNI